MKYYTFFFLNLFILTTKIFLPLINWKDTMRETGSQSHVKTLERGFPQVEHDALQPSLLPITGRAPRDADQGKPTNTGALALSCPVPLT